MTRPGNTKQINISMPVDLIDQCKELAEAQGRSMSNFLAYLIKNAILLGVYPVVNTNGEHDPK